MGYTAQLPVWNKVGVAPNAAKQTAGWGVTEHPPADWFNWQWNLTYLALNELQGNAVNKDGTSTFTGQIKSSVASGTAPLVVASTTTVTNLSAQYLNNQLRDAAATPSTVVSRDPSADITTRRFISSVATGISPLSVTSTTLNANFNADMLDGVHGSTSDTASTAAVRDSAGAIYAKYFASTIATGTAPLFVSSTTLVTNFNSDMVDGYHADTSANINTLVVRDASGNVTAKAGNFDGDYVVGKFLGIPTGYNQSVILLHPIYDGVTNIGNNFCVGTLYASRGSTNSLNRRAVAVVNTSSAYQGTFGSVESVYGNSESDLYTLVTCLYGGVKYIGIRLPYSDPGFDDGIYFDGYARSTGAQKLFLVDYYKQNTSTVLNSEINGSIANFAVNMVKTLDYWKLNTRSGSILDDGSGNSTFRTIKSSVANGTAPFIVSSSTIIPNLNADYVDGYHMNQDVRTTGTPTFASLSITGKTMTVGNGGSATDGNIILGGYTSISQSKSVAYAGLGHNVIADPNVDGAYQYQTTHVSYGGRLLQLNPSGLSFYATSGSVTAGNTFPTSSPVLTVSLAGDVKAGSYNFGNTTGGTYNANATFSSTSDQYASLQFKSGTTMKSQIAADAGTGALYHDASAHYFRKIGDGTIFFSHDGVAAKFEHATDALIKLNHTGGGTNAKTGYMSFQNGRLKFGTTTDAGAGKNTLIVTNSGSVVLADPGNAAGKEVEFSYSGNVLNIQTDSSVYGDLGGSVNMKTTALTVTGGTVNYRDGNSAVLSRTAGNIAMFSTSNSYVESGSGEVHLCANCYYSGGSWFRVNNAQAAMRVVTDHTNGNLLIYTVGSGTGSFTWGSPSTFYKMGSGSGFTLPSGTSDPSSPAVGQMWLRTDL